MTVTKKSTIGDILDRDAGTAKYFTQMGMNCLGCPASRSESIEEACAVHGTNPDVLVTQLNEYLQS